MPLNWNEEPIPSKVDKTTDILGFKEIGSVGHFTYHPFRFKDYKLGNDRGDYCAFPVCRPGYKPEFPNEDVLTGKGLLVSLCNLARQINRFDNDISYDNLIVTWCLENMHPYSVDFIYSELNENFDINTFDAEMIERDGIFEINKFLYDLGKLYNAVMYYVVLESVCIGDDEIAFDLSNEGRYFDSYSFFEKYKSPTVKVPDELIGDVYLNQDPLSEMKKFDEYVANHQEKKVPKCEFTTTSYDDYETLRDTLIDIIPDFNMRLKVNPRTGKIDFSADVQSVFDIAWFTLARMISEDPTTEDKGNPDNRSDGIMIRCRNCGRFIIRKCNRQEFCDLDECQKARNARKQKAYRDRKAIEKIQKAKKKTAK